MNGTSGIIACEETFLSSNLVENAVVPKIWIFLKDIKFSGNEEANSAAIK